ncbi:hypothetical protein KP509_28G023700 [Ceratopteris richardii]|uniref:Secreted protein n=1 Tax=Ceratopteris richardii TaxID=49495 RepID=A0A8T2RC73_CERRI|nr:hypothetical protein KP509_28G023700 [Ceratopteris richardii]
MEMPAFLRVAFLFTSAIFLGSLSGWSGAQATTVRLHNSCSYTVCAKYWVPNSSIGGACSQQAPGGVWSVGVWSVGSCS